MANTAKKINQSDEPATMQVVKNASPNNEVGRNQPEENERVQENLSPDHPSREVPKALTLEQKIQKVEDLRMLIEKYQKLTDARRNLQSFRMTSDGMSIHVRLFDHSTGQEFKTSHSAVIQVVIADMQRILEEKICEVERLIEF